MIPYSAAVETPALWPALFLEPGVRPLFTLGLDAPLAIVKGVLGCGGGGDAGRGGGPLLNGFFMPTGAGAATLSVVFS